MAQGKLWFGYCCRTVIMGLMAMGLIACVHAGDERPVGMTLRFMNVGAHDIGVTRFDPDGLRGPVPGSLGAGGGGANMSFKQMSFMPGDSKRGVPQFVEVEWTVESDELRAEMDRVLYSRADKFSLAWREDYKQFMIKVPRYTRRVDLIPILTPELIAQVRANRQTTNLKLTITFNNDQVSIVAEPEKWR